MSQREEEKTTNLRRFEGTMKKEKARNFKEKELEINGAEKWG